MGGRAGTAGGAWGVGVVEESQRTELKETKIGLLLLDIEGVRSCMSSVSS